MPAPVKAAENAGPVDEAVEAAACRRIRSSEEPDRFRELVRKITRAETKGRPVEEPSRFEEDSVFVAAHIEALAGLRRLRARRHRYGCRCVACHSLTAEKDRR